MHGKRYRFIFIETQFKPKFIVFLAVIIFSLFEMAALFVLNGKITEGETRKALIVSIPEMERFLYPGSNRLTMITKQTAEPIKIGNELYFLKGIRELEGKPSALINNDVYQEGDMIKDYRVTKITVNSVLFKNIKTNEMRILRFSN